jgi:acetyl-CoA carboxylase/biotin carboxylase 1
MHVQFREDQLVRHIEAPLAFQLELRRLQLFNIKLVPTGNNGVHLYRATPKKSAIQAAGVRGKIAHRYFVRSISRSATDGGSNFLETAFLEALSALEVANGADQSHMGGQAQSNNIFLNILPTAEVNLEEVSATINTMIEQYTKDVLRLKVALVEIKINAKFSPQAPKVTVRFVVTNPTGYVMRVEAYVETKQPSTGQIVLSAIGGGGDSSLDGYPVGSPYQVVEDFERNRQYASASSDTLYCYDFLELFERGIVEAWEATKVVNEWSSDVRMPRRNMLLDAKELVLVPRRAGAGSNWTVDEDVDLTETVRPPGKNDIGMVAWLLTMRTPEYPDGRQMVVIANDISFKAGSFGTREDLLFQRASELCRSAVPTEVRYGWLLVPT